MSPIVQSVLAGNAGMMTLDGTNTWIVRAAAGEQSEPGRSIVIDPGPDDPVHLDAVLAEAGDVDLVLYTHRHGDHTDSFPQMVRRTGAIARAVDPQFCHAAAPLVDGEVIVAAGVSIEVLRLPGHTGDSAGFLLADGSLLIGDTILGRGTTVIAHPDGVLGPYLASLERIRALIAGGRVRRLLPGHGPVLDDPAAAVEFYLAHRRERLEQVRAAVAAGARSAREVVEVVYRDVDPSLWPAAELSVQAQLDYLH